jgi:hypothetical protein
MARKKPRTRLRRRKQTTEIKKSDATERRTVCGRACKNAKLVKRDVVAEGAAEALTPVPRSTQNSLKV